MDKEIRERVVQVLDNIKGFRNYMCLNYKGVHLLYDKQKYNKVLYCGDVIKYINRMWK